MKSEVNELISVIVPVYNVKKFVGRCLDSILQQSYTKLEIIVVDDGSYDGSEIECDKYEAKDSRIHVFHKANGGLSDARNFGMSKATGQYFLFIDSDDVLHIDFCAELIEKMITNHADIVSVGIAKFWNDEQLMELKNTSVGECVVLDGGNILEEYFLPSGERIIDHGLCVKMYKRDLFDGLLFDVGKLHEDLYITHKLLSRCKKYVYIDAKLYFYYQNNSNSICNNYGVTNFLDEYECIQQIYACYCKDKLLRDKLLCFCCYHYIYMLMKIGKNKDKGVRNCSKLIRIWIKDNVRNIGIISIYKKIKIIFGTYFPQIYFLFGKIKRAL